MLWAFRTKLGHNLLQMVHIQQLPNKYVPLWITGMVIIATVVKIDFLVKNLIFELGVGIFEMIS